MKRFATFFVYSFIAASIPVQAATFLNVASPYSTSVNRGVSMISGNESLPVGVYSVASYNAPVLPTSNNTAGITITSHVVDSATVHLLPTSATQTIDGGTYTASNPYVITNTADSYIFTNGGYGKITSVSTYTGTFSGNGNLAFAAGNRGIINMKSDFSGFAGTVSVGSATDANAGRVWYTLSGNNRGSENATWIINTTDGDKTGLLFENSLVTTVDNPVKLGKIEGNGAIRGHHIGDGTHGDNLNGKTNYIEIGHLLTNSTDVNTFNGVINPLAGNTFHISKVGAGKLVFTDFQKFQSLHIKEGTVIMGNGGGSGGVFGRNEQVVTVTVEKGASYGYKRNSDITRNEDIIVNGGTIVGSGTGHITYDHLTFNNGGFVTFDNDAQRELTLKDLKLTGDAGNRVEIDGSKQRVFLTGTLTGDENQEIYYTGQRGHWFTLTGCDLTGYHGTITGGPENPTQTEVAQKGTWISVGAQDASTVTFNLEPGQGVAAGLLLSFKPADDKVLKIGALSGHGMVRNEYEAGNFKLEIGGKGVDTTFSGSIAALDKNVANYDITKVGTGTWTITGDGANNAIKLTTIKEGTIQLGDGGTVGSLGNMPYVIEEGGTLAVNLKGNKDAGGEVTINNTITSNNGTISVLNPNIWEYVVLRGSTTGTIIKTGEGALALGINEGNKPSKIIVKEGYLKNWGVDRIASTQIVLAGGTFFEVNSDVEITNAIQLQKGTTSALLAEEGVEYTISGALSEIEGETEDATSAVLEKIGAGTVYLNGENGNFGHINVKEGTLSIGNGQVANAWLQNDVTTVNIEKGAAFGYNRLKTGTVSPLNKITVNGGTLFNAGERSINYLNVEFTSEGGILQNTGVGALSLKSGNANKGTITFDASRDDDITLNFNNAQNVGGLASANDFTSIVNVHVNDRAQVKFHGDMSTFRGDVNISGNCWFVFNAKEAQGSELASWNTNMTSDSGILFGSGMNGITIKLGDLTGNGMVRPDVVAEGKTVTTLEVGALGNDSTFSGALQKNDHHDGEKTLEVVKVGDGTWTLNSEGQYPQTGDRGYNNTANMTVKEGTLALDRKNGQASANDMTIDGGTLRVASDNQKVTGNFTMKSGTLEVADGATFSHSKITVNGGAGVLSQMNGNITTNVDVVNGVISPGTATEQFGNLNLAGNLTLTGNASQLRIDLRDATKYDRIRVAGKLIMNEGSKIALNIDEPSDDFVVNLCDVLGDVDLISFDEEEFNPSDLTQFDWESIFALEGETDGLIMLETEDGKLLLANVNAVPEPSTWALLLMGSAGLYAARRNRRQKKNA